MEVGEAVLALDLINAQLDLAEGLLFILVEVSEGELNDTTLEGVIGILCSFLSYLFHGDQQLYALKPCDLLAKVFPTFLTSKMDGALMSYQSFQQYKHDKL